MVYGQSRWCVRSGYQDMASPESVGGPLGNLRLEYDLNDHPDNQIPLIRLTCRSCFMIQIPLQTRLSPIGVRRTLCGH